MENLSVSTQSIESNDNQRVALTRSKIEKLALRYPSITIEEWMQDVKLKD